MLNITSQWQDTDFFFVKIVYYQKLGNMLKPPVPKFRSELSVRFRNIEEKEVPVKLKPIVNASCHKVMPTNCSVDVSPQYQTHKYHLLLLAQPKALCHLANILQGFQYQETS